MMQGAVEDDKGWRKLADTGRFLRDLYAIGMSFISNLYAGLP